MVIFLPPITSNNKKRATKDTKSTNREDTVAVERVAMAEKVDVVGETFSMSAQIGLSYQAKPLSGKYRNREEIFLTCKSLIERTTYRRPPSR